MTKTKTQKLRNKMMRQTAGALAPVQSTAISTLTAVRPTRRGRRRVSQPSGNSLGQRYLQSISNPFNVSPPRLAAGNALGASASSTLWNRLFGVGIGSGCTCFAACFNPNSTLPAGSQSGTPGNGAITVISAASPVNTLNNAGNATSFGGFYNDTNFNTFAEVYRPVTAGLRLQVRYASTSQVGRLFVLPLTATRNELSGKSFTDLTENPSAREIALRVSGDYQSEGKWKWNCANDAAFNATGTAWGADSLASWIIIIGVGFPADSFSVDLQTIAHVEYRTGVLGQSDDAEDLTPTLNVPLEVLAPLIRSIPQHADGSVMLQEDGAYMSAMRRSANGRPRSYVESTIIEDLTENLSGPTQSDYVSIPNVAAAVGVTAGTALLNYGARRALRAAGI